jgi:hypothetical protein
LSTTSVSSKFTHRDRSPGDHAVRRSLPVRIRVAANRNALTRELATGAPASASSELTLRAAQLSSRRHRRQMAASWRQSAKEARQPAAHFAYATIIRRRAVVDAEDAIDALLVRLSSGEPVAPQGMAILDRLTTDGVSSPLYVAAEPGTLRRQLIVATEAMDPGASEHTSTN